MTILDERPLDERLDDRQLDDVLLIWPPARGPLPAPVRDRRPVRTRPLGARPPVAPLHYRGHGVAVSRVAHAHPRRRPVSTSVTVALAGLAALITLWLGTLANFSGERAAAPAPVPDRLAVVSVHAGETLQQLAGRVAPGAPTAAIADRIRELNQLDSAALDAGQTLIAPVA